MLIILAYRIKKLGKIFVECQKLWAKLSKIFTRLSNPPLASYFSWMNAFMNVCTVNSYFNVDAKTASTEWFCLPRCKNVRAIEPRQGLEKGCLAQAQINDLDSRGAVQQYRNQDLLKRILTLAHLKPPCCSHYNCSCAPPPNFDLPLYSKAIFTHNFVFNSFSFQTGQTGGTSWQNKGQKLIRKIYKRTREETETLQWYQNGVSESLGDRKKVLISAGHGVLECITSLQPGR